MRYGVEGAEEALVHPAFEHGPSHLREFQCFITILSPGHKIYCTIGRNRNSNSNINVVIVILMSVVSQFRQKQNHRPEAKSCFVAWRAERRLW